MGMTIWRGWHWAGWMDSGWLESRPVEWDEKKKCAIARVSGALSQATSTGERADVVKPAGQKSFNWSAKHLQSQLQGVLTGLRCWMGSVS